MHGVDPGELEVVTELLRESGAEVETLLTELESRMELFVAERCGY